MNSKIDILLLIIFLRSQILLIFIFCYIFMFVIGHMYMSLITHCFRLAKA
jgi:hypothetical protein